VFSPLVYQLIESLRGLPGIGPKSAQRMAFSLLRDGGRAKGTQLAETLKRALLQVKHCIHCRNYTEEHECHICRNPKRDRRLLCVVESPSDAAAIEQTHGYSGHYFILHGRLSPLDGMGPAEIGMPLLIQRFADPTLHELILATNPTIEGKATAYYIANQAKTSKIRCSRIAHGVPLGGELEYLDSGTLSHAFQSRTEVF